MDAITEKELENVRDRITGLPRVFKVKRKLSVGGLANIKTKPTAWAVCIPVDGDERILFSARNNRREWTDLNRMKDHLIGLGFNRWITDAVMNS